MIFFKDDYSEGAHPKILEALLKTNLLQQAGYGNDLYTQSAIKNLKKEMANEQVDIHLLSGGTQTNLMAIGSFLRPHEACISAETGHIAVHETGAIEATGHKVITVKTDDGKLTKEHVSAVLKIHTDEHMVKPKMVYISNPTEIGTVYDQKELKILYDYCQTHKLILYADGARLGSALTCGIDLSLQDMCLYTDAFFIGGTKNGALLGEALVVKSDALKADLRYMIKQKGALMAKGRILGIQFDTLFTDQLFLELARHANQMAEKLRLGIQALGYKFYIDSPTNQIFPIMDKEIISNLMTSFVFYEWQPLDEKKSAIRLVTSWATKEDAVDEFLKQLKTLSKTGY